MRKIKKKSLSILLIVFMVLSMVPMTSFAATSFGGAGTESDPYLITSTTDLEQLSTDVNNGVNYAGKYFKLSKDLNLTDTWIAIGKTGAITFEGFFDGDNHTISGLSITSSERGQGLFGYISGYSTIKNLTVEGSITGASNTIGGLVGNVGWKSTIINCINKVDITVTNNNSSIGGIAGDNAGKISDSINMGTIKLSGSSTSTGGIAGISNGEISGCSNKGPISGGSGTKTGTGGIVGYSGINTSKIQNCFNLADIISSFNTGGICGRNFGGDILNCYNDGQVKSTCTYTLTRDQHGIGGIVGDQSCTTLVNNCYNKGNIVAGGPKSLVGGIIGWCSMDIKYSTNNYYLSTTASKATGDKENGGISFDTNCVLKSKVTIDSSDYTTLVAALNATAKDSSYKKWMSISGENSGYPIFATHVTFASQGGSSVLGIDVNSNRKLSSVPTSTKEKYIFEGWYTLADGGTKITPDTVFLSDTTVYAHWQSDFKITEIDASINRISSTEATMKFTSNKSGYYYYEVVEDGAEVPTIDTNGAGIACTEGENIINLSNLTSVKAKDVYIVVKNESDSKSNILKLDIPRYPIYYTITYSGNEKTNGTLPVDNTNYEEGNSITVKPEGTIVRDGYIFDGWNTKQDGKGTLYKPGEIFIMGTSNVILYAQWREGKKYEAEDATIVGANIETNVAGASGGRQVGSINEIGRYVEFSNIPAYSKVIVHYASGVTGKISVYLDNTKINELNFTSTGGWGGVGKYKDINIDINSPKGGALKFKIDEGDIALNIDYIEIVKNPEFNSIIEANTENGDKGTVNVKNAEALGENKYKAKEGIEVALTAIPKEGYNFDGWYDVYDKKVSNSPAWSFKVTEYTNYTAKFVPMPKAALTVSTVGTGNISINGGEKTIDKTEEYSLGTVINLTAIDSENSPFEYWVDNNERIVSTSKIYNLYLGSDTTIKAVFNTKTAATHLVTFKNGVTGEVIKKSYVAEGESVTVSATPYMYGYTFDKWDKTSEEIKTAKDDIVITALFIKNEVKCNVAVNSGTINGGVASGQYDIKEFITVTASAAETGKKFSHWVDAKGNIVCYDVTYKFYVTADIQLTAVYVADESKIEQKGSIVLNATANQDTKKIAFLTTRIVPEGCTIISHGVILTNNSATIASSENFVLGAAGILKGISKDNRLLGTYVITKGNVASGATWYGRGYLIYKDASGNVVTVYSNIESGTIN